MRKIVLFSIAALLVLPSCSSRKEEIVRMISLGAREKSVECPVAYSACEFYVYADEYINSRDCTPIEYEAEILEEAAWLSFADNGLHLIGKTGSGPLRMSLDANTGVRRSARIVLRAENRTDTLRVKQEGVYREYVRLTGEYPVVPAEGGTYEALVQTNVLPSFLKISGSAGIDEWEMNHNIVTFVIGPSASRDRRNLTLSVSTVDGWGETVSGSVTLQQEPGK